MSTAIYTIRKELKNIEDTLREDSEWLTKSGKGVGDPAYGRQTKRLEALMAPLSRAIKDLQSHPEPLGPVGKEVLKDARRIMRELKAAYVRARTQNTSEVLADAIQSIDETIEKPIHQYHDPRATIGVPDSSHPCHLGLNEAGVSLEAFLVLFCSILAKYVQRTKK
jgi:hypothetical protein